MCNMRQPLFPPSDMRPGTNMGLMVSYYTNYSVIQDQIFILPDYSHINLRFCCFPSPNVDLIYSYLTHYPHCWHHPQSVLCNPPLPPQHCFISYPSGLSRLFNDWAIFLFDNPCNCDPVRFCLIWKGTVQQQGIPNVQRSRLSLDTF